MSKKQCELCSKPARMYCESDQASLCWDCDQRVHAANFLVAKHSRTLLCHVCRSPTPWNASGLRFGPTVSVCHGCADGDVVSRRGAASSSRRDDGDEDGGGYDSPESGSDDGEFYSDSEDFSEEEEDDYGENQVVPWSNSPPIDTAAATSPSGSIENVSLSFSKRTRENKDENGCGSPESFDFNSFRESDENFGSSLRPLKIRRRSSSGELLPSEGAIEHTLRRHRGQPPLWRNSEDFSRKL